MQNLDIDFCIPPIRSCQKTVRRLPFLPFCLTAIFLAFVGNSTFFPANLVGRIRHTLFFLSAGISLAPQSLTRVLTYPHVAMFSRDYHFFRICASLFLFFSDTARTLFTYFLRTSFNPVPSFRDRGHPSTTPEISRLEVFLCQTPCNEFSA